uniref:CHK kinase-like domain-containing protein n=1 Tax=Anopheles stephensi TaxID=30069 RepID=A0A182XXH1_ANOST
MSASKPVTIPEWMTNDFFIDAIANALRVTDSEFTIEQLDVHPATEAGDNFVSIMYRVKVTVRMATAEGEQRIVSLIVKALPRLGLSEEMIMALNVFPKEMAVYTEILPAFEQLYRERGVEVAFGPRCLKHCTEPTDIIVMEDLKDRNFQMAVRQKGLDLEHCHTLLRRLAQFHAASAVYYERNGPYDAKFKEGMYAEKNRAMFEQFQAQHDVFMYEVMCKWPNNGKLYAELMKRWGMEMFDVMLRITKPDPAKFNVLNHGDMWCNNMMFQYDDNEKIKEITLVDFQMCMWSSPVIDLHYFIFSSVRANLKLRQLDHFISYYYQQLTENLTLLQYGGVRPSLQDLHSDFIERQLYGLSTAFSVFPICVMEKTDNASIDLMLDQGDAGTAFKQKMYNGPAYVEQMIPILEYFYEHGAFDINQLGYQRPAGIQYDRSLYIPLWLDEKFFDDVVDAKLGRSAPNDRRIVRNIQLELATKKGDNYASVLYRAKVDVLNQGTGVVESFSTIVKAPPKGILADHMSYLSFSAHEIQMYRELLPAFEQLYRDKGISARFGPTCLKVCEAVPADVLVLEDLLHNGNNRMADRRAGLDQHHTELVLEQLAKFHAASVVYVEQGNVLSDNFKGATVVESMKQMGKQIFQPMLDGLIEFMANWDFVPADHYADLKDLAKTAFDELATIIIAREDRFNVLNHGDLWTNNMMFSTDANRPTEVTLLDFQMCCWASPVIDLHSFLFSSVQADLKLSKLNYFLRYYQERLVENLVRLGYRKRLPTLQQLLVDFNDHLMLGLIDTMLALPFALVPDSEDASLDTAIENVSDAGKRFQKLLLDNEELKMQMKQLLPYFRNRGVPRKLSVPEWMTKEYFVDAIAVKLNLAPAAFTITELDVRRATEAGDNYASILYRVRVSVRVQEPDEHQTDVSLIVKALPSFGIADAMIQMMNLFPKETAMYTDIIPAMEALYHARGRTEVAFGPRCLKHSTEPTEVIVLEDLCEREFVMVSRRQGMDLEHTRLVLRRLAQFHAASVVLERQRGSFGELFKEGMVSGKGRAMTEPFHKAQAEFFHRILHGWSEQDGFYADLMKHWGMDMFDALLNIIRPDPTKFNVLNHGDMWCNNVLLSYNENSELRDILLIDYQLSFWSSPAMDLLYFIFTSVNGDLKLSQMDYMIQHYHEQLIDSLKFLEYGGALPLLKDLHSDIVEHHLFGLMISFSILPVCLMEKSDDASMDIMMDQGDAGVAFKLRMYNNPAYVKQMQKILEFFYNTGVFDIGQIGTQRTARIDHDPALELPLWMDREFVEHIVDTKFGVSSKDKRTVRSVYVKSAAKKGDNYASALYSAKVSLHRQDADTEETLSLIIKAPPKGIAASYSLDKDMYERELYLYEQLLPAFEQLYRSKGVSVKLGPRYYKPRAGLPEQVIVLEDLTVSGFRMADRQKGLDKPHVEAVLDHLARFHAASAVYCESPDSLPKVLTESAADRQMAAKTDAMFAPSLDSLFKYMKEWDFAADYVEDLETISRQIYQLLVDTWALDVDGFNVLNHGDAWLNNVLFAYDHADTVQRVAMVDYQFPSWGSPVFDLIHLLFSSVQVDLKLSKQAYFLRYYQERLVDNLVLLGYRKRLPTLQQLHVDFNNRLSAAIKTTVIDLPYVLVEPSEDASQEAAIVQTEAGQKFQQQLFDNDRFREHMKELLPYFRARGLLTAEAANCKKGRASCTLEMANFEWINSDLLTGLLVEQHGTSFRRLVSYEVAYATKKGDNYASEMYRVALHYDIGMDVKKNIILKVMPSGELQQQVMQENNIYQREIVIYGQIMANIYKYLRSFGDDSIISPVCLTTTNTPKQMLVFEDALDQGFKMVDRRAGLDLDHARLVIVKLAKLHACSRIVYEEDPALFDLTLEGCISDDPKKQTFLPYYRHCVRQVMRLVGQWNKNGRWDQILRKLEKLQHKIIPYGCDVYRRRDDCFNVLNHNDIWVNNMLFSYGKGTGVKDVLLLDYQLSFFGSPGVDLNFFLYGSLRPEVRAAHLPDLVQLYHATLRTTLERVQYGGTIPTLPDIHVEIIRKGFHRVNAVFQQMPIAMMERSEGVDMDLLLGEGERTRCT